jgi:predicted negative regulator of RcsB-dependent stress response
MSELLSDREQEEALRNWIRENWPWVASGIAVGFVVLAGWYAWQQRTEQRGEAAAQTYRELTQALTRNDKDKVDAAVKILDTEYSGSPYADQAHLLLAQSRVNGGQFEMAATELKYVADKSKDPALAQIAKVRLARVQIQLGHYDEALALLDVNKAGAFVAQVHEVRGDALLAKGDVPGARASYQAAILAGHAAGPNGGFGDSDYLQLKLEELSVSAEAAPNAAAGAAPTPKQ